MTTVRTLLAQDLSEIKVKDGDGPWLADLQRVLTTSDHVIRLGGTERDDEYVVTRDPYGRWRTGRYIGEISYAGRRLEIRPRLGDVVLEQWLADVMNLVAIPETAARQRSRSFIARLMGAVWCRSFDVASRHGPPSIRVQQQSIGPYITGRLDIPGTIVLRSTGTPAVASIRSARELNNDVSRVLVAAERTLTRRIGHAQWHTPRVDELLPRLHGAVGTRPHLPTRRALAQIRYSPITRPFKAAADLSWRIANLEGLGASPTAGKADGLLLDVAELWELYVLHTFRRTAPPAWQVNHGTVAEQRTHLLHSYQDVTRGIGRLKPDVLVTANGEATVVADAKYKRLADHWPDRPAGVDRGDMYQLATYLSRYSASGTAQGLLIYPDDPTDTSTSTAEKHGPWRNAAGNAVTFLQLPITREAAVNALSEALGFGTPSQV
jgi:5-methylcytosine-specific restriction enzyme subunit McrC